MSLEAVQSTKLTDAVVAHVRSQIAVRSHVVKTNSDLDPGLPVDPETLLLTSIEILNDGGFSTFFPPDIYNNN